MNAGSCQLIGKTLPSRWQEFATALAIPCHRVGKIQAGKEGIKE